MASQSHAVTAGNRILRTQPAEGFAGAMHALDEVIHQKVRLAIMSTLMALGEADFKLLKETLRLSDGNLSTHLSLLEEHGYVEVRKEFRGRKTHTSAVPTEAGRAAFNEYLGTLERIIQGAQSANTEEAPDQQARVAPF